jgi:DNA-binding SARP family transcriptional activator
VGQFGNAGGGEGWNPATSFISNPVRLHLIGQMEAWSKTNTNLLPSGRKARALLAILVLSGPQPVSRIRIAELLWSRRAENEARASLRQELHHLLSAFSPAAVEVVLPTRLHIGLAPGAVWTDVAAVMSATPTAPDALSLLKRDLLECLDGIDPAFDLWLKDKRQALRDGARSVAADAMRRQIEPDAVIVAAKRLLQVDRAHEGAWRNLMNAYAEKGERGMAIRAYDQCRDALASTFDVAPSNETQQLLISIRGTSPVPRCTH